MDCKDIENLILKLDLCLEVMGYHAFVESDALALAISGTDVPTYCIGATAFPL